MKKILVVGIIFLFIGVGIQPVIAFDNTKKPILDKDNLSNNDPIPDLIVDRLSGGWVFSHQPDSYYQYSCYIKNIGEVNAPIRFNVDVEVYKYNLFSLNELIGEYYRGRYSSSEMLAPGESYPLQFYREERDPLPNTILKFKIKLECDYTENTFNNNFRHTYLHFFILFRARFIPLPFLL